MPSEIILNFNIDGIPISKCTSSCFWPILCKTNVSSHMIVIGIYHGNNQPKDFNIFLRSFADELKELIKEYCFKGNTILIRISVFILDTPARSHVLCTKSHAGYSGCCRCTQEGEFNGRVVFIETNVTK